ncbi:MAG: WbqC family protein [Bacteroidales bacterium]|nr:WbqC family protein [Bacteroidales bacterium]
MLLSTAYFPPLSWLALAARDMTLSPDRVLPSHVLLEACENYQKQSYRNRCYILAGDGPQMLQVPVVHGGSMAIRDVQVDYSTPWVLRTQRALDTAYETAAYYEYYRDDLFALLDARPATLWELNLSSIRFLLDKTGVTCALVPTTEFIGPNLEADDYRFTIHPKHPDTVLEDLGLACPYYQVFRDRLGRFTQNLSSLDLLFNEGPDSIVWLKKL